MNENSPLKIMSVVGARPNFMKIAPFCRAIERHNAAVDKGPGSAPKKRITHFLVHTGQHYDERMSRAFFDALDIPHPDMDLGIGSGSHAEQVGQTMIAFEKVIRAHRPDWVVVVGDVNATCACSITAKKEGVNLAHIEAGLRSGDLTMPEEINRLITDRLADLLLTPDVLASENLRREGVEDSRIRFVGNIMIDTLEAHRETASRLDPAGIIRGARLEGCDVPDDLSRYALITMHRPSNVDREDVLRPIITFLCGEVASRMPLIWPIHPRTRKQLEFFGLWDRLSLTPNVILLHPVGYHEMLRLNMDAALMLTDSGGLQEECCVLGTPCLTLRWNTERPVTLREYGGASVLVGTDVTRLKAEFADTLMHARCPQRPELWDGHAADRIVQALVEATASKGEGERGEEALCKRVRELESALSDAHLGKRFDDADLEIACRAEDIKAPASQ